MTDDHAACEGAMQQRGPQSIARYNGGKTSMLSEILPLIPDHETYIEVFGGAASVVLNKPQSPSEVYNDINGDLVHLVRTIRDSPDELAEWLRNTPSSRQIHTEMKEAWHSGERPTDPIKRAGWTFYLLQCSYGASLHERQGWRRDYPSKPNASVARQYQNKVNSISTISDRLNTVSLEQEDWQTIFDQYDHPQSFFYLDPPYKGTEHRVTDASFDHDEFLETLAETSGLWLLSYGSIPERFDSSSYDVRIMDREKNAGSRGSAVKEALIANYDPDKTPMFSNAKQATLTDGGFDG